MNNTYSKTNISYSQQVKSLDLKNKNSKPLLIINEKFQPN